MREDGLEDGTALNTFDKLIHTIGKDIFGIRRTIGLITEATVGKRISRSTKTTQQAVQNGVRGDDGDSAVG